MWLFQCCKNEKKRKITLGMEHIKNIQVLAESDTSISSIQEENINIDLYDKILRDKEFCDTYSIIKVCKKNENKVSLIVTHNIKNKKFFINCYLNNDVEEKRIYDVIGNIKCKYTQDYVYYRERSEFIYFVIEYLGDQTLFDAIFNFPHIQIDIILKITLEIMKGIYFLHTNNILHRDIKPHNIMINKSFNVTIIDYDLSKLCKPCERNTGIISDNICGTIAYIAPESYALQLYSEKTDIWSIGIVLYNLLTKTNPFNTSSFTTNHNMIKRRNRFKYPNIDNLISLGINKQVIQLVLKMLNYNDSERPNITECIEEIESIIKNLIN